MKFQETALAGAYFVDLERLGDGRGFFARTYCRREFADHGIDPELVQCNISFNAERHTLRGMHFQAAPHGESKLVRCTMGALFDVIVDLRPESPTHLQWLGVELSAENRRMLFIPEGMAHGFITLCDNTEIFYQMSAFFVPAAARGVRWNDSAFGIRWPHSPRVISERDANWADYRR